MQKQKIGIIITLLFLLSSCLTANLSKNPKRNSKLKIGIQAGLNKGGIVDNTNLNELPDTPVDAYSGATRTGFNSGVRLAYPVGRISLEAGSDYMVNFQTFTYNDPVNVYSGKRAFNTSQLIFPTTLNFGIFRKNEPAGLVQLKIGHLLQYNMVSTGVHEGTLPSWSINKWSNGALFGISFIPFRFSNGASLGMYMEAYRGTQIYEDTYNQKDFEMPGSAFFKYGIIYNIR